MTGKIEIENKSPEITEIDIEGVIGVPQEWQLESQDEKIATYEKFKAQIEKIRTIASPEIVVNIRSSGGNVNDALLIHDALTVLGKKITTRCYGYVASAATIIAQAASTGRREISANALYLIHRSVSAAEGNANDIEQTIGLLRKTDERLASIYATRSGKTVEEFIDLMNCNDGNGKWLSPREAKAAALVDRIIGAEAITNDARKIVKQLNLPEIPGRFIQNNQIMKIKQHWNAILDFLGLNPENESRISGTQLKMLDTELSRSEAELETADINEKQVDGNEKMPVRSVSTNEDVRRMAQETSTESKEDPSPVDGYVSANAKSYEEDSRNFK